ncbi:MAG: RHS repeat protein, partial [Verrucomicrobia bacterium]|nr:RHS repeat protein [Verrucomicrobiota bacterium]
LGQVVVYGYSAAGDLEELHDGKGNITRWEYDTEGRPEKKRDANNALMFQWDYDANGRLTNRQTPAKGITQYDYDAIGNLLTVDYPSSPDITYTYDALNRLDTMQDAIGLTDFDYTNAGRLQTENGPWPSDTVTLGYNAAGQRSGLAVSQPSAASWTQTYSYDGGNRLQTIANTIGTFQYQYTPGQAGRQVAHRLLPGGGRVSQTHNTLGQLTGTWLVNSSTNTLNYHGYTHDALGQRTRQTRTDGSWVNYDYDTIGQLTDADTYDALGQSVTAETYGYAYDDAWNLSTRNAGLTNELFTVNNLNQLTGIPSGTPSYDTNGNLTSDGGALTCQYDDENQLISVESMSSWPYTRTEFEYDGKQRIRIRTEYQSSAGNWSFVSETRYIYDGMRVVEERNSSNQPTARYTRGLDLSGTLEGAGGIGGLLAMSVPNSGGWSHHYYHADGNGNITALMNQWGNLSATYKYDPYGRTISQIGSVAQSNPYRFSSKEWHAASSLYYYGYRFYSPEFQRWLNRDPIKEDGGINLYGFAGNNLLTFVDINGLDIWIGERPGIIPHQVVIGDDGNGGSYLIEFGPTDGWLVDRGIINYQPYPHTPASEIMEDYYSCNSRDTSVTADMIMNKIANSLDGNTDYIYCVFIQNCRDFAKAFFELVNILETSEPTKLIAPPKRIDQTSPKDGLIPPPNR